tara:strand:- start:111 stop:539 length:429 start_codon:yes stop_codon:yes gene_type:complete
MAVERWLMKRNSMSTPSYVQGQENGALQHELNANIRTIAAEWAVAKHYGWTWSVPWYPNDQHTKRKGLPDVGERGEVRTVRTRNAIPYWLKDKGKLIIGCKVVDEDYYATIEIYGTFEPVFDENHFVPDADCYRMPVSQCQL